MNVAEIITDRFIKALESGVIPWETPWKTCRPLNFTSKHEYSGINVWTLSLAGFSAPRWATFNQIKKAGGTIIKGSKPMPVIFYKIYTPAATALDPEPEERAILRYTQAYNYEQTEGIELDPLPDSRVVFGDSVVDRFIEGSQVQIESGPIAGYSSRRDVIVMPGAERFISQNAYYSTVFHEMVHSTGHKDRLDRFKDLESFGSGTYSMEEMVAEIGSSLLRAGFGIESRDAFDQSASYVSGWLSRLRDDPHLILTAARRAEDAVKYLNNMEEEDDVRGDLRARVREGHT
jgi:antirestriction protein ArdC